MKFRGLATLAASLVVVLGLLAGPAVASECKKVQGTQTSAATGPTTIDGEIKTNHIKGTTHNQILTATPRTDGGLDYTSTMTITTKKGTLTTSGSGSFFPDGTFTETDTIASGTDKYAGASGQIVFNGRATSASTFEAAVTGTLCGGSV